MSNPEIDRRCAECGASVRSGAVFCPQCGAQIVKDEKSVEPVVNAAPTSAAEGNLAIEQPREEVPDLSETQPLISARSTQDAVPDLSVTQPLISAHATPEISRTEPLKTPVAPGPEKNVQGRVKRLKQVSSVVIDQAAYDPSLRFILVAAALCIVCLFLFLLSRVLG
jgi:uncharacterized Zn finger protein (UPF0148 family)